jgi:hypothetical protein
MRGFVVIAKSELQSPNVGDHALCSSCKRVVEKDDCFECMHCAGHTCSLCSWEGKFVCCLASCLESAEIKRERILELSQGTEAA